ncbi:MAG: hypothetical protein EBR82_85035 [Caulobacteraceae bacterium]|nr:hypothetical protein [Caulobacteraceae bacterium]
MTEKELQLLGFYQEGYLDFDGEYHYYVYDIVRGLSLISNSNDEVAEDGEWFVEFFDTEPEIRFTEFGEVQALINLLQSKIIKKSEKISD